MKIERRTRGTIPLSPAEHYFATVAPEASFEATSTRIRRRPAGPPTPGVWERLLRDGQRDQIAMRLLPPLVEPEPLSKRLLFLLLAASIALGFLYLNLCFWAPAHPGIDQNGYLVGGRMLADHGSTGYQPTDPHAFVGGMWIGVRFDTPTPEYFPKYPIGLPAIYALCLKLGPAYAWARPTLLGLPIINHLPLWLGQADGTTLAYLVSPVCMTLAVWVMFLLGRLAAGSFAGIVAMLLLATSQVTLGLANNPNSHASALCFVTFGIYFVLRWWMTGTLWRGVLGGLLAGYAVTIRYTEGLLVLPIAVALLSSIRWRRPSSLLAPLLITLAWALPVGLLVWFNLRHIGHVTGYDPTNESEGFTWKEFSHKWEFTAQQVYDHSVFFITPLAVLGMAMMYRQSKRVGLFVTAWFVPIALLYTAYYWGANIHGLGFLRFFVTLFPAMILPAVWLIHTAGKGASENPGSFATPIAGGLLAAIAGAVGLHVALPGMARESAANLNLAYSGQRILSRIAMNQDAHGRPLIFADQDSNRYDLAHYLQFVGDVELFAVDAFRPPIFKTVDSNQPRTRQPARQKYLDSLFAGKKDADFLREQHHVIKAALDAGRPVYAVLEPSWVPVFVKRYMVDGYLATPIDAWREPAVVPAETADGALGPNGRGFVFPVGSPPQTYRMFRITHREASTTPAGSPYVLVSPVTE